MPRILSACAVIALALVPVAGSAGPKRIVPAQIALARYVCLGYETGNGFLSEAQAISAADAVFPEDRQVLDSIRDELERWGRYVITVRPEEAQLLIAVRVGRRFEGTGGVGIGIGGGSPARPGLGLAGGSGSAQFSSGNDMLTIYESRGGRPGANLWRDQTRGALSGEPPRAFEQFRGDVERTPDPPQKKDPPRKP
jgi:hypothetical protein